MTTKDDTPNLRREFDLTEEDTNYLLSKQFRWETIKDGDYRWLIIYDYPLPPRYQKAVATLALLIEPTYPDTQIDMVFFSPALQRTDGQAIHSVSERIIDSQKFQQWSRHRTAANPWRPGIDGIETHLMLVNQWIKNEL